MTTQADIVLQKINGKVIDLKKATLFLNKTDTNYAKKMLEMFINTVPKELDILEKSYKKNQWDEIVAVAHRLRGCTIYAGAYRLHTASANLENVLSSDQSNQLREKLYQTLLSEINKVKEAYQKLA